MLELGFLRDATTTAIATITLLHLCCDAASLTPCFSAIPPPLKIRFNCPKHPSRNLGGLPSSWMLGGAHIDFTAPDLDQLWMLVHNADPTQPNPPTSAPLICSRGHQE